MQDILETQVTEWKAQFKKGTLELAILALLRQQPRYGLELLTLLNGLGLDIREGSIYPLLTRLRNEDKVKTEWVDEGAGHAHKYYTLTPHGKKILTGMHVAWNDYSAALHNLLGEWHD